MSKACIRPGATGILGAGEHPSSTVLDRTQVSLHENEKYMLGESPMPPARVMNVLVAQEENPGPAGAKSSERVTLLDPDVILDDDRIAVVIYSVRTKLFGGLARFQPPLGPGRAEARMPEAFFFGVSAKRRAQRLVSGAWPCGVY